MFLRANSINSFGYVQFADLETATKACEQLNNTVFSGRRLNVQYLAKPQNNKMGPNPPSKTLFIGNMNYEMTDEDINELFKDIKNCLDVRVAMDRFVYNGCCISQSREVLILMSTGELVSHVASLTPTSLMSTLLLLQGRSL